MISVAFLSPKLEKSLGLSEASNQKSLRFCYFLLHFKANTLEI